MTDEKRAFGPDEAHLDRAVEPEYASISGWAVFSLVLSAMGALALLPASIQPYLPWPTFYRYHLPGLFFIPLLSAVLALAAMRGIGQSGGTKVGLQPARIALGLSLVFMAGSLCYHGLHQRAELALQDELQAAAAGDLGDLLAARYDTLLDRLAADGGSVPADRQRWIAQSHGLLYGGGDYYGRQLMSSEYRRHEISPEETRLEGLVIYRLTFKEWSLDLLFQYVRANDEWKLVYINGSPDPLAARAEGLAVKKRFE